MESCGDGDGRRWVELWGQVEKGNKQLKCVHNVQVLSRCCRMPSSTVCRSLTLKDGKGSERWNLLGKRLSQVSSPMNTTRLPAKEEIKVISRLGLH